MFFINIYTFQLQIYPTKNKLLTKTNNFLERCVSIEFTVIKTNKFVLRIVSSKY